VSRIRDFHIKGKCSGGHFPSSNPLENASPRCPWARLLSPGRTQLISDQATD